MAGQTDSIKIARGRTVYDSGSQHLFTGVAKDHQKAQMFALGFIKAAKLQL